MPNVPQAERPVAEQTIRTLKPDQEFWKPILSNRHALAEEAKHCLSCGKDFAPEANFCHTCGTARRVRSEEQDDMTFVGAARPVMRTLASAFFAAGLAFALIAAILGSVYAPSDFDRWQTLQSWRIEWLLGAAVAFLASLCLKMDQSGRS